MYGIFSVASGDTIYGVTPELNKFFVAEFQKNTGQTTSEVTRQQVKRVVTLQMATKKKS